MKITDTYNSFYAGKQKFGKLEGQGSTIHVSGNKYIGAFKDGEMHGQGTFTKGKGNKFVGEMKDNKHWNGTFFDENGNIAFKVVNGVRQ